MHIAVPIACIHIIYTHTHSRRQTGNVFLLYMKGKFQKKIRQRNILGQRGNRPLTTQTNHTGSTLLVFFLLSCRDRGLRKDGLILLADPRCSRTSRLQPLPFLRSDDQRKRQHFPKLTTLTPNTNQQFTLLACACGGRTGTGVARTMVRYAFGDRISSASSPEIFAKNTRQPTPQLAVHPPSRSITAESQFSPPSDSACFCSSA
jgi:hypothetical protein